MGPKHSPARRAPTSPVPIVGRAPGTTLSGVSGESVPDSSLDSASSTSRVEVAGNASGFSFCSSVAEVTLGS
eukprot:7391601-Prorocentrum_lima.AAC.1